MVMGQKIRQDFVDDINEDPTNFWLLIHCDPSAGLDFSGNRFVLNGEACIRGNLKGGKPNYDSAIFIGLAMSICLLNLPGELGAGGTPFTPYKAGRRAKCSPPKSRRRCTTPPSGVNPEDRLC